MVKYRRLSILASIAVLLAVVGFASCKKDPSVSEIGKAYCECLKLNTTELSDCLDAHDKKYGKYLDNDESLYEAFDKWTEDNCE